MRGAYQAPEIHGFMFWSVYTSDPQSKRAVMGDEGGRAYAIGKTAQEFDIPVDDVRAELFPYPYLDRPVWHAYVKDVHRSKVVYVQEQMNLMLRALSRMDFEA